MKYQVLFSFLMEGSILEVLFPAKFVWCIKGQISLLRPLFLLVDLQSPYCNFLESRKKISKIFLYPPQTLFVVGILFSCCPSVRASVRPSVRNALFP